MNIFHIPSDQNFLQNIIKGAKEKIDPSLFSKTIILLPSHRSCRELERILLSEYDDVMIPKIIPIASLEESLSFEIFEDLNTIPKSITYTEAKFLLANLIKDKTRIDDAKASDHLNIAGGLMKLIMKFEKEDMPIYNIDKAFLGDHPIHIEKILNHLQVISSAWPKLLSKLNVVTPITRRNLFIKKLIKKWEELPPSYPIIIAGSTGTFRTTQMLLNSVSKLKNSFVILQGVDHLKNFEDTHFDETHPSFQLNLLLKDLQAQVRHIESWYTESLTSSQYNFASILFKKEYTDIARSKISDQNIEYIECASLQEEANLISIKVRETLEFGHKNIGIISNNKSLRMRLKSTLELWNIDSECSDGIPITSTPQIKFIFSIFRVVHENFTPISLLTLLTNELNILDHESRNSVSKLEIKYLRGIRKYRNISELIQKAKNNGDHDITILLEKTANYLKPVFNILNSKSFKIQSLLNILIQTSEDMSSQEIWSGDIGEKVHEIIHLILQTIPEENKINLDEFEIILSEVFREYSVYSKLNINKRVSILSPIESRLLSFDYTILSGLNEKSWPETPEIDPWLSTAFYKQLKISSPHTAIGQSANDFLSLLNQDKLLITRSINDNNSPQIPSRWITKLELWFKAADILDKIKPTESSLKTFAKNLHAPESFVKYSAPSPKPEINLRPSKLSVTQIEKLMRDPYSVYASKILKLKPLEKLDKMPDQLEFGNFIHATLDLFHKSSKNLEPQNYLDTILQIGNQLLADMISNPVIHKIWQPRFYKIAAWVAEYETNIRNTKTVETEVIYSMVIGKNFTLTAKADRIEYDIQTNTISVLDFKTGSIPTNEDVRKGFSPQLTLEALLIEKNHQNAHVSDMIYIQLASGKNLGHITKVQGNPVQIIDAAKKGILRLIEQYGDIDTPYLVCPNVRKTPTYNDFEHLERLEELLM